MRKSLWLVAPLLLIAAAAVWWRSDPPDALASSSVVESSIAVSVTHLLSNFVDTSSRPALTFTCA